MVNGRTQPAAQPGAAPPERGADGQLLEQFARGQDGAAFAAVLRRHGPMVLGVCRRVLRGGPDAEDAFQATFLVLARKAAAPDRPELLASWLYGVAYRTAQQVRTWVARRRRLEREAAAMSASESEPETVWQEVRELLDEELQSLPEKYRAPLVLCYLEGLTDEQAARVLGWPATATMSRLARGRAILRDRLAGRLRALLGVLSPAMLSQLLEPEAVPEPLLDATVQAARAAGLASPAVGELVDVMIGSLPSRRSRAIPILAALVLLGAAAYAASGAAGALSTDPDPGPGYHRCHPSD
jgi:RNA polymerase sigma-70 factor (ECF subfamily)